MFSCVGASGSHSEQPFSTGDSQDAPIGGERDPQLFFFFFPGCRLNFHTSSSYNSYYYLRSRRCSQAR